MAVRANTAEAACRSVLDRVCGLAAPVPSDGVAISPDPREQITNSPKENRARPGATGARRSHRRARQKRSRFAHATRRSSRRGRPCRRPAGAPLRRRSEEHTSELQSPCNLVCRLLLEKKKKKKYTNITKQKKNIKN